MTPDAIITLDAVTKRYGGVVALDGLSLAVARGEMFGMIGPDGAGKTTALRLICGLLRPDNGGVQVLGRDPRSDRPAITGSVGYLSQRFSLYGDLSIDENIAFAAEIHGVRQYRQRRDRLLAMTQLTAFRERRADRLSGGMRQKLALACTLIHEPDLLVLDEPTTGVDPLSRREFWTLLSESLAEGITIVLATPYMDEAERCGRVALLHAGRLLALDDPSRLRAGLPGGLIEVVADQRRRAIDVLRRVPDIGDVQAFGDRVHARLLEVDPDMDQTVRVALARAGIAVTSVRRVPASLEDVFIDRLGSE